jgi:uncharacterized RDD family membrane protein YckC
MERDPNPYSPPKSDVSASEDVRAIVPASRGRRFGTQVVDYVGYFLIALVLQVIVVIVFGADAQVVRPGVSSYVFNTLILLVYYIVFEGIWARTPGKFVFGTVVVSESGGKPSIGQVTGRTLCRMIPFEALSFFGARGWHDSIPGTYVVMVNVPRHYGSVVSNNVATALYPRQTEIAEVVDTAHGTVVREDYQDYPRHESNLYLVDDRGKPVWFAERLTDDDVYVGKIIVVSGNRIQCASREDADCELDLRDGAIVGTAPAE